MFLLKELHVGNVRQKLHDNGLSKHYLAQFLILGINERDREMLIHNIDVIFHNAATVRFDVPLKDAILVNVRSTRDIVELALEAKHIKAFVYVSTAFCNSDKMIVEEKIYPAHCDWEHAIQVAEKGDTALTNFLTLKYIFPLTNSYIFTKSLAEHVVNDRCLGKIPAVIIRPTIGIKLHT